MKTPDKKDKHSIHQDSPFDQRLIKNNADIVVTPNQYKKDKQYHKAEMDDEQVSDFVKRMEMKRDGIGLKFKPDSKNYGGNTYKTKRRTKKYKIKKKNNNKKTKSNAKIRRSSRK